MTIEELWVKVEASMTNIDNKLDEVAVTVRLHEQTLAQYKAELSAVEKKYDKIVDNMDDKAEKEHDKMKNRIDKLEKFMWLTIGAGGLSGAVITKLFGG